MRRKEKWIKGCLIGLFGCLSLMTSCPVYGEAIGTDTGIGFTHSSETETKSSTDQSGTVPSVPENPTTKPTGRLPMTGELLQPIMFLLVGWFFVLLIGVLFLKKKQPVEGECK